MNVVLLGPQRHAPTVKPALEQLGVEGPVALISAGWQEREGEVADLEAHLGRPVVDLGLYRRAEHVLGRNADLARVLRARQAALQDLQAVYRSRLRHAGDALREVLKSPVRKRIRAAGLRAARRDIRRLDREHLRAIGRIRARVDREIGCEHEVLAQERAEIEGQLEPTGAILVAGGHVAILLNRLRLFGAETWLARRPVVGWAAGAMALTERIVLFHDHPPQGANDPELLDTGLGLVPGIVALPDAVNRLDLEDRERVASLATRFRPARCFTLDDGSLLSATASGLACQQVRELTDEGDALAAGTP